MSRFVDTYRFAECRTLRHRWTHKGWITDADDWPSAARFAEKVVVRETSCDRCGCVRAEWFVREMTGRWDKAANRYRYPTGYRFIADDHPGETPPTVRDFNNAAIEGLFLKVSEGI